MPARLCPYQKLVVIETIGSVKPWRIGCSVMFCSLLFRAVSDLVRLCRLRILVQRHQLLVPAAVEPEPQACLQDSDRILWVWLSRLWPGWPSALLIVKPETVIAWHRKGFRRDRKVC